MKKIIGTVIGILGIIALSLYIYHSCFETKVAFVDIPKVFNGFAMKKELQEKYKKTEQARQRMLDSLSMELQLLSGKLNLNRDNKELIQEFDFKRDAFFKSKRLIEEDNAALSSQYDKQILEQMTQYMQDYGKSHDYDLIHGADGNGAMMYANQEYNISDEVTQFINDKYKGIE